LWWDKSAFVTVNVPTNHYKSYQHAGAWDGHIVKVEQFFHKITDYKNEE